MRSIYLANQQNSDSPVALESARSASPVNFVLEGGDRVQSVRVIKNTIASTYPALLAKAEQQSRELVDLLLEGDPEIDFRYAGKISRSTKQIYLDPDGRISFNLRFQEQLFDTEGQELACRPHEVATANNGKDQPLCWTGRYMPLAQVARKLTFSRIYQLCHTNGLTFDFLFAMAADLEQRKSVMLMGAGPSKKEPLRMTRGSLPYRAFLMGRTQGETYRLTLHLSNLELKDVP